jgi:hypothetical protein
VRVLENKPGTNVEAARILSDELRQKVFWLSVGMLDKTSGLQAIQSTFDHGLNGSMYSYILVHRNYVRLMK